MSGERANGAEGSGWHATPRQLEILKLVAAGLSDKQIAMELRLSPRTVRSHLDRLFQRHGLHTRAEAVAAWMRTIAS